jgi:general stress protein 26
MTMTLSDLSEKMSAIDFTMLSTYGKDGEIASRPMSNNGDVDSDGDSFFFTTATAHLVAEIAVNPTVGLTLTGGKSLLGAPGIFISIEGKGELIRDKAAFAAHWTDDLDEWFPGGVDSPDLVLLKVHASRIHYWDGEDEGEIPVSA